jgi:hypothetical protein
VKVRSKHAHTRTSLARESASGSLTREPGSDVCVCVCVCVAKVRLVTLHTRTSLTLLPLFLVFETPTTVLSSRSSTYLCRLTLVYLREYYVCGDFMQIDSTLQLLITLNFITTQNNQYN